MTTNKTMEEIADRIQQYFFVKGATVSKEDFKYVLSEIKRAVQKSEKEIWATIPNPSYSKAEVDRIVALALKNQEDTSDKE